MANKHNQDAREVQSWLVPPYQAIGPEGLVKSLEEWRKVGQRVLTNGLYSNLEDNVGYLCARAQLIALGLDSHELDRAIYAKYKPSEAPLIRGDEQRFIELLTKNLKGST